MAIDTAQKRSSVPGFGLHALRLLPPPDGTVHAIDRPHLGLCYSGITPALGVVTLGINVLMPRRSYAAEIPRRSYAAMIPYRS